MNPETLLTKHFTARTPNKSLVTEKTNSFGTYYWSVFVRPRVAFERLTADPHLLKLSITAVTIPATLYTLVYVFLIYGGGQPFKPWLDIPLDIYYRYNVFFCAPSMVLGWILAAAVVQVLSRLWTTSGSFEQTLGVFAFGIAVASWSTGLHDFLTSFLGAIHVISQSAYEVALNSPTPWRALLWVQMTLYLVWFIVLLQKVYGIKAWRAIVLGTTGFLVYQLFFLIFNR